MKFKNKSKMSVIIYKITSPSGKSYVGQTQTLDSNGKERTEQTRWKEHINEALNKRPGCIILNNAIRKYGPDNFQIQRLCTCETNQADNMETRYICEYNTLEPYGYNVRSGGKAGTHSDESRIRMSYSKMGDKNYNYGKPRTNETRLKISEAKSGPNHHFYSKTLSADHKIKLSASHKIYDANLPMYICYIKERPSYYQSNGYVVIHPKLKKKYFTSKNNTLEQKLKLAMDYLSTANED
jgi:group I intron endonuclease